MVGEGSVVSFLELGRGKVFCLFMKQPFSEVTTQGIAPDSLDGTIGFVSVIIFPPAGGLP